MNDIEEEEYLFENTDSSIMDSSTTVFTICYVLIGACLVAPPTEFVTAGLTIQNVLSNFLGSEQLNFIHYHIRRTVATLFVHSLLPLGYFIGMGLMEPRLHLFHVWTLSYNWLVYLTLSLSLPLCAFLVIFHWSRNRWSNHPISKSLSHHASSGSSWHSVASSINVEFRRIDKFTTGSHGRRLVVTDSWVVQAVTYKLHIAHQSDIHLTLDGSEEHHLSHESSHGIQILNITVRSVNPTVQPFRIRLNAAEYSDLRDKLSAPIRNARNIVIQQSLSDRFLEAFREQVQQNPTFRKPASMELESCIGCMQTIANIKLQKLCDNPNDGECVHCYCRPMWCLECMSKWFASRQDQNESSQWMSSVSPCPTCRSPFCVLDVCKVV